MKKLLKRILCVSCVLMLILSMSAMAACGEDKGGETGGKTYYTVTFDTDGGSAVASQQVEAGAHATAPEDPTKSGYFLEDWYKEAAFTTVFNFETEVINANTTVYAKWAQASAGSGYTGTFYLNYDKDGSGTVNDAGDVCETKTVNAGGKLRKPADPVRAGYAFGGWYTDAAFTTAFVNNTVYTGDQSIYAKWLKDYIFEAEKTRLTGITSFGYHDEDMDMVTELGAKKGVNFSGNTSGKNLIGTAASASGGAYIHYINLRGAYIDFEITSDKDETGAELSLQLSAEFWGVELSCTEFKVLVNAQKNSDTGVQFNTIDLKDYAETGTTENQNPTWKNCYIGQINLKAGKNVIRLYVANDAHHPGGGTINAKAPMIDYIKISSTSELTMTEY